MWDRMTRKTIARYLTPWRFKREKEQLRFDELRKRDGDKCARCRRPIEFDRPAGHELGAKIERIAPAPRDRADALANLCLTHGRCNVQGRDHTDEVLERLRPAREAELFAKSRKKKAA